MVKMVLDFLRSNGRPHCLGCLALFHAEDEGRLADLVRAELARGVAGRLQVGQGRCAYCDEVKPVVSHALRRVA